MALGDIFGGLGMGLGAAASGGLTGQNRAEQVAYQRSQQALDREYKKAYLASKKKENDPWEKLRERAGQAAQRLEDKLFDPAQQAFYASPQGRPFAEMLARKAQKWRHIEFKRIDPSEADTYELTSNDWMKDLLPGGGGGAPGGGLGGTPLSAPEEAISTAGKLPFLREPGTSIASFEGVPIAQTRGLGLAPGTPTAGPPIPAGLGAAPPVPRPAAGPAPETALQRYERIVASAPKRMTRPGQRPQDADREYNQAYSRWQRDAAEARAAIPLADQEAARKADLKTKQVTAHYAPKKAEQESKGRGLKNENLAASTTQIKALTPVKKRAGVAAAKESEEETKAIPKRLELQGRQVTATERNAKTAEKRYGLEVKKFNEAKRRADAALEKKARTERGQAIQKRISATVTLLGQKLQRSGGIETPRLDQPTIDKLQKQLFNDMGALRKVEAGGGSTTTTETVRFKGRPDQVKPVLGQVRAAVPKAAPSQRATVIAEMRRRGYSKAKMQKALKDLGL